MVHDTVYCDKRPIDVKPVYFMANNFRLRPGLRRRLFHAQYRLNPQRRQRATVSGFTMMRTLSQSVQILRNSTQNPRSTFESRVRFIERRRAAAEERHSQELACDEP